ncbi:MAG: LamG domain-containing protein [Treponema sp.]|nr:LamG domain-containing protein [Treponema sp.]
MKKILMAAAAVAAAFALASCGSGSGSGVAPFLLTEDSGVVGYYTFDEGVEDNEVVDHSFAGLNVYTAALDGSVTVPGKFGDGLQFSGDEYITLDSEILEGDGLTIAAWVKAAKWNPWARVFDIGNAKPRGDIFLCNDMRAANMLGLCIEGAGDPVVAVRSPIPVPGKWTHIAATFGNGKVAMYLDGKLTQELDTDVTIEEIAADAQGLYIGRSNWADPLFEGVMDDILVANRVFSAKEIARVAAGVIVSDGSVEK